MSKSFSFNKKRLVSCALVLMLLIGAAAGFRPLTVFAEDGSVSYKGGAERFIFEPGTELSLSDFFPDFKDVMPGDVLTQRIRVKNDASDKVKVRLYLRSLGFSGGSEDFLRQLELSVEQDGEAQLFEASADATAQLTDRVCLGTFSSGADTELSVTLRVSPELGNDFQEAVGYIDWEFVAEEIPVEDDDPRPVTGDESDTGLYIALAAASAAAVGIILVLILKKKKRKDEKERH